MVRPSSRLSALVAVASVIAMAAPTVSAQQKTLQNDSFADNSEVGFQGGFCDGVPSPCGEIAASTFVPDAEDYPVRLSRLQILFGGGQEGEMREVGVQVWRDSNPPQSNPGELVYSEDIQLTSANQSFNEIDFSAAGLTFDTPFRIGIVYHHTGFPGHARDTDGNTHPDRNWIFAYSGGTPIGWFKSRDLLVQGDWIARALVLPAGANPNNNPNNNNPNNNNPNNNNPNNNNPNNNNPNNNNPNNNAAPLAVTNVTPTTATNTEDVQLTIFGSGFEAGMTVRVGSIQLTGVSVQNESGALGMLPAGGVPGTYDVIAQVGAETAVYPSGFTITAGDGGDGGLMLTDVQPDTATFGQETAVTLVGADFDDEVTFSIGGEFLTSVVIQNSSLATGIAPASLRVGTHPVVASRGGEEAILTPGFEVVTAASGGAGDGGCTTAPGKVTGGALFLLAGLLFVARRRLV
jgi:hypothetical protein